MANCRLSSVRDTLRRTALWIGLIIIFAAVLAVGLFFFIPVLITVIVLAALATALYMVMLVVKAIFS